VGQAASMADSTTIATPAPMKPDEFPAATQCVCAGNDSAGSIILE
jgi:hypothetical protein